MYIWFNKVFFWRYNQFRFIGNIKPMDMTRAATIKKRSIYGHRPVIVKRAVIGFKGGWKLSTIFLICKVFHDWSTIKLGIILYLLEGYIFCCTF